MPSPAYCDDEKLDVLLNVRGIYFDWKQEFDSATRDIFLAICTNMDTMRMELAMTGLRTTFLKEKIC
jgi:hypothetical protein